MTVLPRWDTSTLFEGFDDRRFVDASERIGAALDRLAARFDHHGIGDVDPAPPTTADLAATEEVLVALNDVMEDLQRVRAFVRAHLTTDSRHEHARVALSVVQRHDARLRQLQSRLAAWVAACGPDPLAAAGPVAAAHAFTLARTAARAEHQMGEAQELLYAELAVTGSLAWARLHGDVTSQLTATVAMPSGAEQLPMAAVRGLATHPDPTVRRAAHDAELAAWPGVSVPLTAAMNAIKGEAVTVNTRRRWNDPLDASLFANAVDRESLDAMHAAVDEALPHFRRWLRAKARLHGHPDGLPWWDLVAPLPASPGRVTWEEGIEVVDAAFGRYRGGLAAMVGRALAEGWVDAEPRDGKEGGAFCMSAGGDRSLVFLNWSGSPDSVQTLAHELGHAWHNVQLAGRTALQRQLTMALAETASIFCEALVVDAGLARSQGPARLSLLDTDLQRATQIVVDIRSRFLFETQVFRRRASRVLPTEELCEVMAWAQGEAYGDGLHRAARHPWMWAVKGHYYSSHFYNWPYTFGLLFGLALFAHFESEPDAFRTGYDDLLSSVGMAPATDLARRFGIDLHDVGTWRSALSVLQGRIDEYERLAGVATPADDLTGH